MKRVLLCVFASGLLFSVNSCKKDKETEQEKPFVVTDYFVAGTISPQSGSYESVYLISLLENNKAVFIGTGNDLTGEYTLSKDSLIVTISDANNFRTARFAINDKHELTSAYYRALTMEYKATGTLVPIAPNNTLSGKTFKGDEFKMGPDSNVKDLIYKFSATANSYGNGTDEPALDVNAKSYGLIHGAAFKHKSGSVTEIGFLNNKQLTVFRSSGLFYYGKYTQQ